MACPDFGIEVTCLQLGSRPGSSESRILPPRRHPVGATCLSDCSNRPHIYRSFQSSGAPKAFLSDVERGGRPGQTHSPSRRKAASVSGPPPLVTAPRISMDRFHGPLRRVSWPCAALSAKNFMRFGVLRHPVRVTPCAGRGEYYAEERQTLPASRTGHYGYGSVERARSVMCDPWREP